MIIILSQNKEEICFSDHVYRIHNEIRTAKTNEYFVTLGTYPTEERAKEVVAEIFGMIKCGAHTSKTNDNESYTNQPWYEMPKE